MLVAAAIHALLLLLSYELLPSPSDYGRVVDFEPWTLSPPPEKKIDDTRYRPKEEVPEGQVVRAPDSGDHRRPEKKKLLSERNNRVLAESQSRIRLHDLTLTAPSLSGPGGTGFALNLGGMPSKAELGETQNAKVESSTEGSFRVKEGAPNAKLEINLKPSLAALNAAVAGAGLDHVEDVPEGGRTFLNTVEWRHATFFNRVKWQVEQYWRPDLAFRGHDPYGNIYGYKDRETVVRVVLDPNGKLLKQYVISPSGVPFLDDEATEAIAKAEPFPNPPAALVDPKDGIIAFNFGFIVRMNGEPVFRVRRYDGP